MSVPAPRDSAPWFVVLVVTTAQLVAATAGIVLATIAPKVADTLQVSPVLIGYQASLTWGVAMVASIYGGNAVLRWGAGSTTQASMALSAIGVSLFAVPHVAVIALGSVIAGIGTGIAPPAAAHLLVRYTAPERRNLMFSIKQTGVPVGGVLIALIAPALAVSVGWQWSLATIAAVAVAVMLMVRPYRETWDDDRHLTAGARVEAWGGVPLVLRQVSLRWISLASVLFSSVQRIMLTFTVLYLVAEADYGLVEAGIMLSVVQIGGAATRVPWGWLADRWKSGLAVLKLICALVIVSSAVLVMLEPGWPRPLVYLLFLVLGAATVGWNGVFHAECARLSPPGMTSMVAGGTAFFVFSGSLIGPSAFAIAYDVIGTYSATFGIMIVMGILTLGLLWLAGRTDATGGRSA
ncbi:MAG: MFS transporter [Betaproteobacteria bacterium]|nr:MFS transporter [Betaproteobacteria bacterium]